MLAVAGVGGGLYMFRRAMESIIRVTSNAEEIQSKFNVVFAESARQAGKWSETFAGAVGRSEQDVKSWMATLQDTFVPLGFTREKALELSKSLTTLGVDVASFNNKVDAEVIRNFTSALVGNHEAVRSYGVMITESTLKQEAINKGLNKTYKQLTDLEKVQLRYGILMRSTTDAQGDAIRTSDSYANQVKRLSAQYTDLQTVIGQQFVPEVAKAIKQLTTVLSENDEAITRYIRNFREGVEFANQIQSMMRKASWWQYSLYQKIRGEKTPAKVNVAERAPIVQPEPAQAPMKEMARMTIDQQKAILTATRQTIDAVRHMDYLTRRERIEHLRIYVRENQRSLDQVEEANKALNTEIQALERSRLDAMRIYWAGLREDMEDSSLFIKEKFRDVAVTIEGAMSGAFQSMIAEGASWRDAMSQFFTEVGNAFAKMAADMVARAIMAQVIGAFMGGAGGGGGGGSAFTSPHGGPAAPAAVGHGGGMIEDIAARRTVPISTFIGAPRLHQGLASDEIPAILQRGERVIPKGGGSGPTIINNITNNITIKAIDSQDMQKALAKERNFLGDLQLANYNANHPIRRRQE
jgi:hypothetical protein